MTLKRRPKRKPKPPERPKVGDPAVADALRIMRERGKRCR